MERDGYEAVQLAFGEVREKRLTKAELGHLKKADAPRAAAPARVPRRGRRAPGRRDGDRRGVREGPEGQGLGHLEGQGLPGHDQAPQLLPRARVRTARTTSAPRARSAPRPTPRACSRASAAPARWATSASPSAGSRSWTCGRTRTCCCCAARCRAPRAPSSRSGRTLMAAPRLPTSARSRAASTLDDAVFGEEFHEHLVHEAARAELNARRRGTASTRTRGEVAMTGAKAWRQKGTGRAACRRAVGAAPHRRRRGLRAQAARLHRQGQPQGPPQGAPRRALGARRARLDRRRGRRRVRRARRPSRLPRRSRASPTAAAR